eukprot:12923229-Prorocentrum_lima.AAC.1
MTMYDFCTLSGRLSWKPWPFLRVPFLGLVIMLSCSGNVIDGGGRLRQRRGHRGFGSSGQCQLSASPPAWLPRNHCCQYGAAGALFEHTATRTAEG